MTFAKSPLSRTKPRKCPECHQPYVKRRAVQPTCGALLCQESYAIKVAAKAAWKREKMQRAADRSKLKAMLPRKHYVSALGAAHRAWVRARDEGKPCISCDTILVRRGQLGGDYDAGHARSVGSAKHLEFDDRNVHGQCKRCNRRLGGNYAEYLARLPARIGQEAFDALMCDQEPRKYSIDDLKALRALYVAKLKELKHE